MTDTREIMTEKEIYMTLEKYNFPKDEFIILSGAALVMFGIKHKTNDIDIAVTPKLYDYLLASYNCEEDNHINSECKAYLINNEINFGRLYYTEEYDIINGYKVQKLNNLIKFKQKLNREKDKKDLILINKYLNSQNMNVLTLAYLGDAVYELYIRRYIINQYFNVNDLQKESINYVSAKAQSNFLEKMLENNFLTYNELEIVKRARNHKSHKSKTTDIITYKRATGLEALIGYLSFIENNDRIEEIMKFILEIR